MFEIDAHKWCKGCTDRAAHRDANNLAESSIAADVEDGVFEIKKDDFADLGKGQLDLAVERRVTDVDAFPTVFGRRKHVPASLTPKCVECPV